MASNVVHVHLPSRLSWYESNRVRRMTRAQRTRWHESSRVNKIQLQLRRDLNANRISEKEYHHRFKKDVVDVRRKLTKEHNEEYEAHGILRQDVPILGDTIFSVVVKTRSGYYIDVPINEYPKKKAVSPQMCWKKNGF